VASTKEGAALLDEAVVDLAPHLLATLAGDITPDPVVTRAEPAV